MNKLFELATGVVRTLHDAGYVAYFAGGWVRDLLLERPSHEIDIATSASPAQIALLFPKTIPVGIAFGVMIVVVEGINFEVTTFRQDLPYLDGRHPEGVAFSTPEEDALRRDFTINGLFYNPLTEEIHDYVGGREDLKKRIIRAIGDPAARFTEDRLRMIRAVRFATTLHFQIDDATKNAIVKRVDTLFPAVSMERIWQELSKMVASSHFDEAAVMLHRFGLLQVIFPQLAKVSLEEIEKRVAPFVNFPKSTSPIVYLMELMPEEGIELCHYLKTSVKEIKLMQFFLTAPAEDSSDLVAWTHFYAHPDAALFLAVREAKISAADRSDFHERHEKRRALLKQHIERIEQKKPLVTAALLQEQGVKPGVRMGELLKDAERIAITRNLDDAHEVLKELEISDL